MDLQLVVPPPCLRYALLQNSNVRNATTYTNLIVKEFQEYQPYLPDTVNTIVAIGCGMGAAETLLARKYPNARLTLVDGDGLDVHTNTAKEVAKTGWHQDDTAIYNDRSLTEMFMKENGVTIHEWKPVNTPELLEADLIFSLISWGHHYPLNTYNVRGRCLADLRVGQPGSKNILDNLVALNGHVIRKGPKGARTIWTNP